MEMLEKIKTWLKTGNNSLWMATAALIALGTLSIYLLAPYQEMRSGMPQGFFFGRYLPYLIFGIIMMISCSRMSQKSIIRFSYILGGFSILLLLFSFVQPHYIHGANRYVPFMWVNLNPYLLMLPAYIVLMSNWLSKESTKRNKIIVWFGSTALTLLIVFAAIRAPYMSMAATYCLAFLVLTMLARKKMPATFYTSIAICVGIGALFVTAVLTMPHVHARLSEMMYGTSYMVQAAKNAIHSSSFIGSNAESIQAIIALPDVHTDLMFAGIVAKMGLLVGGLVIALYLWAAVLIAKKSEDTTQFRKLMNNGILAVFILGMFGNITTSIGGLQYASYLPFMSCSWNALLSFCIMFGFILSKPENN